MLPVLTEAGVVDAGAAGLVEIVRGLAAALTGEPLPERPAEEAWRLDEEAVHLELSRYRYCTVFLVEGEGLDAGALEAELEPLGDSLFVVGDASALKVHVHTDDPGRALSLGVARGTVEGVEIANMHAQTREREERLLHAVPRRAERATAAIAVVGGTGNRRLFESLRRADRRRRADDEPVDGRAARGGRGRPGARRSSCCRTTATSTWPPSTRSRTRRSRCASCRPCRCRPGSRRWSRSTRRSRADENAEAMAEAAADVATGAVTVASRDVQTNGLAVSKGAWLGLADGLPVAGGASFEEVTRAVLERLLAEPRSVLTLLTGEEPPALDGGARRARARPPRARARGARGRAAALRAADLGRVARLPSPRRARVRGSARAGFRPARTRASPRAPKGAESAPAFTLARNAATVL